MTTPDREEMPTEDRTASPLAASLSQMIIEWVDSARGRDWRGGLTNIIQRRLDRFQSPSCNAYEPMKEALNLSRDALEQARLYIEGDEETHGRQFGDGNAVRSALAKIDAALSTLPVNDRHHSGSEALTSAVRKHIKRLAKTGMRLPLAEWSKIASDILLCADTLDATKGDRQTSDDVGRLREALKPFSEIAGELFAQNYNKDDVVTQIGDIILTFEPFLNALAALKGPASEAGKA